MCIRVQIDRELHISFAHLSRKLELAVPYFLVLADSPNTVTDLNQKIRKAQFVVFSLDFNGGHRGLLISVVFLVSHSQGVLRGELG